MASTWRQTYDWKMARDVSRSIAHGWTCLRSLSSCKPETKRFRGRFYLIYLFSSDAFPRFHKVPGICFWCVWKWEKRTREVNSCTAVVKRSRCCLSMSIGQRDGRMRHECVELCQLSTRGHRCGCQRKLIKFPLAKWYVVSCKYCMRGNYVIIILGLLISILWE